MCQLSAAIERQSGNGNSNGAARHSTARHGAARRGTARCGAARRGA